MFRRFIENRAGNYMMMTAALVVPLMGALAVGVDYTEMTRQRQMTLQALDAAGIATARLAVQGASEEVLLQYAKEFFEANLNGLDPAKAKLTVTLPDQSSGGQTLKLQASLSYDPYFLPVFLTAGGADAQDLSFTAESEIRLKNTLEVALVLDNSGSMDIVGTGSGRKRMDLLKEAATQLVETIAQQGSQLRQIDQAVRFSVVPFAASVNVGPQHANALWMDRDGRSPIHHENFNWSSMPSDRRVVLSSGVFRKQGSGWGAQENQIVTRFTMYNDLRRVTGEQWVSDWQNVCTAYRSNGTCRTWSLVDNGSMQPVYGPGSSWAGCVETRPGSLAYDVTPPSIQNPETLFVPMFAPDETDLRDSSNRRAMGNWWPDLTTSTNNATRQRFMPKYFEPAPLGTPNYGIYEGPNAMCSTTPITPLTDVTTAAGLNTVKNAIASMRALGGTDIPEGTAWGWRTITSTAPFTEARPESERGNDKVLIVLTDGFNTYYTPNSLGYNDLATNRSIYSNQGYTGVNYNGGPRTRLFMNTSVTASDHSNANFTRAMNQHLDRVCTAAKAAGVIVMTVALDLSTSNLNEREAIEAMTRCASNSRYRRDPSNPDQPAKLFWNANGGNLAEKFREIGEELSNLRIVG